MADDSKKRRKRTKTTSGRVTPKGTKEVSASKRYTPPNPQNAYKPSSRWVPIFMFGFFGIGVLIMLLSYLPGNLLPGPIDKYGVLIGIGFITLGFVAATRYR